jgi:CheY-like chemotaxis protein
VEYNILPLRWMIKENYNIDIEDACNGKIALDKFKVGFQKPCKCINRTYRLILMDIAMPVMDGIDSTKKIMKLVYDEKRKSVSNGDFNKEEDELVNIVAITAFDNKETKEKCLKAGMKQIIHKPLSQEKLLEIM